MEILIKIKKIIVGIPLLRNLIKFITLNIIKNKFFSSKQYWETRYKAGLNSGDGSYGKLAKYKGEILNAFVKENNIRNIIEFGCGDGNQLKYFTLPEYLGFDVSNTAIENCSRLFINDKHKTFKLVDEYAGEQAELVLSLDVIYHLVERNVFFTYINTLFKASTKYVIIYSSNTNNNEMNQSKHVKHRKFSEYVELNFPDWKLMSIIPNKYPFHGDYKQGTIADFFIYGKTNLL